MSDKAKLTEAFSGPELAVLQKYQIADENGQIRQVELRDPSDDRGIRKLPVSPIIDLDVLRRLMALDQTEDKHVLDWIFYVAGGGKAAFAASQKAVDNAKDWLYANVMGKADAHVIDQSYDANPEIFDQFAVEHGYANFFDMKRRGGKFGIGPDYSPIEPMTKEQADEEWRQDEPILRAAYFYGDEDVAKEKEKLFAYYQKWPGRDGVYDLLEKAVTNYNALNSDPQAIKLYNKWNKAHGQPPGTGIVLVSPDGEAMESPDELNRAVIKVQEAARVIEKFQKIVTTEKKKISEFNRLNPNAKFKTSLGDYETLEDLAEIANNFTRGYAKIRAQQNIQFHGKAKAPATGYTKGPNEVIYDDEYMTVVIPATAGASLKAGWANWCISSKTFWDKYFQTGDRQNMYWDHPSYENTSNRGVFAFWTFKLPEMPTQFQNANQTHETYRQLAGFFNLGCREPGNITIDKVVWTDKLNSFEDAKKADIKKIEKEIHDVGGEEALRSFYASVKEVRNWIMQHTPGRDIEGAPALESLARRLVAAMLGEVRDRDGRLRV